MAEGFDGCSEVEKMEIVMLAARLAGHMFVTLAFFGGFHPLHLLCNKDAGISDSVEPLQCSLVEIFSFFGLCLQRISPFNCA